MKTRTMLSAVLCISILSFGTTATAQDEDIRNDILRARFNTLYGPNGLITVPNAYVATPNRVVAGTFFGDQKTLSGNYGIFDNFEVGATFVDRENATDKFIANGKVNIVPSNFRWFELGIGVIDVVDAIKRTYYVVATADLATPEILKKNFVGFRATLGGGTGLFKDKLIGGAELLFNNQLSLIGEYNGVDGNFAARYVLNEFFRFQAGVTHKDFFVGLCTAINLNLHK